VTLAVKAYEEATMKYMLKAKNDTSNCHIISRSKQSCCHVSISYLDYSGRSLVCNAR